MINIPDNLVVCCSELARAFQTGTDNEMHGALMRKPYTLYDQANRVRMGCDLEDVKFCPWCGKRIKFKKPTNKKGTN